MQQQDPQQHLSDLQQTTSLVFVAISSVTKQVKIWSHVPGTCGRWFFGWMYPVGECIAGLYYTLCVTASGEFDAVPYLAVLLLRLVWLAVHQVTGAYYQLQGQQLHSYEPGISILQRYWPRGHVPTITLVADLLVTFSFAGLLSLCDSPVQASFYGWLGLWLIVAHVWIELREARRVAMWRDSQLETERFSERISGR